MRQTWIKRVVVALGLLGVVMFFAQKISYLTTPPGEDKDCDPAIPDDGSAVNVPQQTAAESYLIWKQRGGEVNDASCVDETRVHGVVKIHSADDIKNALVYANENGYKVTVAGAKHSMGGHAFSKGNLVLDMTEFNAITLDAAASTITVESGATWHDIQNKIHPTFAVKAMQSTDIFTVGGSISVNAHGMDHQAGAVENSIRSLRVMLPTGDIKTVSRTENVDLYNHIVGGYGLFAIILEATLDVVPNDVYQSSRKIISYEEFPRVYEEVVAKNSNIGLMYTHLSTAPGRSFLKEGIMYLYERTPSGEIAEAIPPLGEVSSVKLRRLTMNLSKYGGLWQTLRWWSEKYLEPKMESCSISRNVAQGSGEACLVARNEPMHDSVPYLKNSLKKETDILHEYFIPRRNIVSFINGLRETMERNHTNLLNASIRVVNKEQGMLTYAPEEAFSVVLYINQKTTPEGHEKMKKVTTELIDLTTKNEGRFFLPYQLYYTKDQLKASYPNIDSFFADKLKYDPDEVLTNTWYEKYKS